MTLHEAMSQVLATAPGRRMTARELCEQVTRRGLYRMQDGRPVEVQQIHARVGNYPQLFTREGQYVVLRGSSRDADAPESPGAGQVQAREPTPGVGPSRQARSASGEPLRTWPWEGEVQRVFVDLLLEHGWSVTSTADTATKARGVDVLAAKAGRLLGAEVKGYPSTAYADRRRAGERKPTAPTVQAGHWFSQALFKAILLVDSHPDHESVMVLPDEPRYRDLTRRTRTGRARAGAHVVLLRPDGSMDCETWVP